MEPRFELRSERNEIVPVSQLPPELPARICQFIADDESCETKPLDRIIFSHVSHHWRDVALNTPSHWRVISLELLDFSAVMLQRSKMADLVLYGRVLKTPKYTQIFQLALSHMERVCEITICFHYSGNNGHIQEILGQFPKSAPRLRSLSITPSNTNSAYISLPRGFPLRDTPCLRQLVLTRCNFLDWDSKLLTGLTYLKLHRMSRQHRPSAHQVLDALRRMPALLHLVLRYASPFMTPDSNATKEEPVHLPKLKDVRHQQTCILVPKFLVFSCVSVFPETWKHGNMENTLQLH